MNPQYVPQQLGGPPPSQGLNPASRGPPTSQGGFQNIPLGPQKPHTINGPAHFSMPPSNQTGVAPAPLNRPQIPPSQLPPDQRPPSAGPRPQSGPAGLLQNGPPQMNGSNSLQTAPNHSKLPESSNPFGSHAPLLANNPFNSPPSQGLQMSQPQAVNQQQSQMQRPPQQNFTTQRDDQSGNRQSPFSQDGESLFNRPDRSSSGTPNSQTQSSHVQSLPANQRMFQPIGGPVQTAEHNEDHPTGQSQRQPPTLSQLPGQGPPLNQQHGQELALNQSQGQNALLNQHFGQKPPGQGPPLNQQHGQDLVLNQSQGQNALLNQQFGQKPPSMNQLPGQGPPLTQQHGQELGQNQPQAQNALLNQQFGQKPPSNLQSRQGFPPGQQPGQVSPLNQQYHPEPPANPQLRQGPQLIRQGPPPLSQQPKQASLLNSQPGQGPPLNQPPKQGPSLSNQGFQLNPQTNQSSQQNQSASQINQSRPPFQQTPLLNQQSGQLPVLPPDQQGPLAGSQFPGQRASDVQGLQGGAQLPGQRPPGGPPSLPMSGQPPSMPGGAGEGRPPLGPAQSPQMNFGHPPPLAGGPGPVPQGPPRMVRQGQPNFPGQPLPGQPQSAMPPMQQGQYPPQRVGPQSGTPTFPSGPQQGPPTPASAGRRVYPGQQAQQFGQPPQAQSPPGNQYGQLNSQMQGMNLQGPPQPGYPTMRSAMNGADGGPHMPPPLSQHQHQQLRGGYTDQYPGQMGGGYPGSPPGGRYPGGQTGGYPDAQPDQKKLDPEHMPNPIQVINDDQANRSGIFCTNMKGQVPPLVTTDFVVQDEGNASPRLVRSTIYMVPTTHDVMKQTNMPLALLLSPMARYREQEYPPPLVDFGQLGPVRCIRCKAYISPYMQFVDGGRRFQCLMCKATTDVPAEYFQHLDHTGQRVDRYERPELILGAYELAATADYCRNNVLPKPPAFIFVIDVSYNNVKSGLVNLLCSRMKEILAHLPVDRGQDASTMRVGFITYSSSVHFYNIRGTLAAPQMMVVGDVQEMFVPILDGFLCTPEESGHVIDQLMEQIPQMFKDTRETETILLPAILAGYEALKAAECVGKLLVFHSSLPTAEAPGKLKARDDRKLLGTDKERTVLTPQNQAYNTLGQDCVSAGCSVDLFVTHNSYVDLATIGQVARLTGGEIFKYTYFQADIDGDRLIKDVIMDVSRPTAFDAIMRVRTSTGIRPTDFYGHFFMSNTTDIELASIDCDKAVAVELKHDDKLSEDEGVYIQAALLYTSCGGHRRLRIINLTLRTTSQMADLYRGCEADTLINYLAKQAVHKVLEHSPKAIKDGLVSRAAQMLGIYRKHCASPSSAGQLILPDCAKLLPLYINCLLKSDALSGGSEITIDDRTFAIHAVLTMDVATSVGHFYPRLVPLHDMDPDSGRLPQPVRTSVAKINDQGAFLLENGIHMFLWVGLNCSPEWISQVLGAPSAAQADLERTSLPELETPLSKAVRAAIDRIRSERHRCMRLTMVRQGERLEPVFRHFLVEDRGADGSASYVDFLCHMHKEIRALLS